MVRLIHTIAMSNILVQSLPYLSLGQKICLARGNIKSIDDLFLLSADSIMRRCSISLQEVNVILDLCSASALDLRNEQEGVAQRQQHSFSTGSSILDAALGNGIRPGYIYELVGERYFITISPDQQYGTDFKAVLPEKHNLRSSSPCKPFLPHAYT